MNALKTNDVRDVRGRATREGGFTIIETVIALCIMTVVGFGAVSLFVFSISYNAGAGDRAHALAIAQQRMEALRATPYTNLATMAAGATFNGTVKVGSQAAGESDEHTFTVATTVENDPNTGSTNTKQKRITVTVTPANSRLWAGFVSLRMCRGENAMGTN
jgi:Tfp pilus assembly protein PilV